MAKLPTPILFDFNAHSQLLEQIVEIHQDCIVNDDQLLTFLPDQTTGKVDHGKLLRFWQQEANSTQRGLKDIIIQMSDDTREAVVAGVVVLSKPPSETGPFRGLVEKLMVSPLFRRRGVARRLMLELEKVAMQNDRGLLILDTTIGRDADYIYPRLGYKEFGIIPRYGVSPKSRSLVDERFFYKDLRMMSNNNPHSRGGAEH